MMRYVTTESIPTHLYSRPVLVFVFVVGSETVVQRRVFDIFHYAITEKAFALEASGEQHGDASNKTSSGGEVCFAWI